MNTKSLIAGEDDMGLFKKKKTALPENAHYTLKCRQCGMEVVHIPREHTPDMQFTFAPKTQTIAVLANGITYTYGGYDRFFHLQTDSEPTAKICTTLDGFVGATHAHMLSHNVPL